MQDFFIYRYIRLDTGNPFYVGKGRNRRAKRISNHNIYVTRIAEKFGCEIEYILINLNEETAYAKEAEFIKLYKDMGYCEANFSEGGKGGNAGTSISLETRKVWSKQRQGVKNPRWTGFVFTPFGKFNTTYEASKLLKLNRKLISNRCASSQIKWKYWYISKNEDAIVPDKLYRSSNRGLPGIKRPKMTRAFHPRAERVKDITNDIIYQCLRDASEAVGIKYNTLRNYLTNRVPNKTSLRFLEECK